MDIVILIVLSAFRISPSISISTHHVRAVSPRDYIPQPPDKTNWELGLKEATFQALIREQIPDPRLKQGIYDADIEGFQDSATPFGDIAVIARGQLYSTNQGYQFVQDPYQNDCDDCHTPHRCERRQCEPQIGQNLDKLIALWFVKRIRHRDPKLGHRYEIQYTISPISNSEYFARNGRFDYSVPGHVFIVKLKENSHKNTINNFKILPYAHHQASTENHYYHTPNSILLNTGEYYYPSKDKTTTDHVFNPGFLIGISPNGYKHIIHDIPGLDKPYIQNKQQETTPKEPIKHLHHHFYIPEVTDIDLDKNKSPTMYSNNIPTRAQITTPEQFITTQQFIPVTTQGLKYPVTINPTVFEQNYPQTTLVKVFTNPTSPTPFNPSPFYVQYSEPDPFYNNNQPPTVATYFTQTINPTELINEQTETIFDFQTQATTSVSVTTQKTQKYPDSINAQLPAPDNGSDTTIPYVASTAITIVSTIGNTDPIIQQTTQEKIQEKATTVQEKIQTNTAKIEETTENIIINTTPYESSTMETIYLEESTTMQRKNDQQSDESSETVHIPKRPTIGTTMKALSEEFTTMQQKNQQSEESSETVHIPKRPTKAPIIQELFGTTKISTTTLKPIKKHQNPFDEIFSDFKPSTENIKVLTPHSQLAINKTDALKNARISKYLKYKRNKGINRFSSTVSTTTEKNTNDSVETKTSQSYITSISFKVNKNDKNLEDLAKINHTTTDKMQTFDDVAQTLVNHARIASYLSSKSTKPTRRSYKPNFKER